MKEKSVTIPSVLFNQLCAYIFTDEEPHNIELYENCLKGIEDKIDRIIKHELYTQYKTAPTDQEREQARKDYLDKAGISLSFRW